MSKRTTGWRRGRSRTTQAQESDPSPTRREPSQASAELKAILEALIFASPEPLTRKAIDKLLISEPKEDIEAALAELKRDYERPGGLQLVEVAGGYQITTRQDLHEWVRRLFHERTTQKLTVQALETLAVIAYKQPITAVEITEIRGVNTSGVLNTLLERHLIKIVGRKQVVGRPFLYATTKEFLIRFGLNDLSDLPKVEDMAEALGFEAPLLVEQTPAKSAAAGRAGRGGRQTSRRRKNRAARSISTTKDFFSFFASLCVLSPLDVSEGGFAVRIAASAAAALRRR